MDRLQLINEKKEFSEQLTEYTTDKWQISQLGFDYNVIAVFGSQSTGKSTLLNRLFETEFDVMDTANRKRTTKGVWLSKAKSSNVLVLDVEGTDGRERGEDQEFERRTALFSLAVAEVIIINLWENMVGLYNGANMGLLKTVLEVNLQLFHHDRRDDQQSQKTLLLFVIRDFIGTTPLENLKEVMRGSLEGVWTELGKPKGSENASLYDFFDFEFTTLPHKILQADKFDQEVMQLRQRFERAASADNACFFKSNYHKNIPADGFPYFAKTIWEKITSNKDLDLPTQRQLLAQYRCDEITTIVFGRFCDDLKEKEALADAGNVLADFAKLQEVREKALESFQKDASRYHKDVFDRKNDELLEKLNSKLHLLFLSQLRNLRKKAVSDFKTKVQAILRSSDSKAAENLILAQNEAKEYFSSSAREAILSKTGWSCDEEIKSFIEEIYEVSSSLRREEMNRTLKKLLKGFSHKIGEVVCDEFLDMKPTMWDSILDAYKENTRKTVESYAAKLSDFGASEEEIDELDDQLEREIWESFWNKVLEECSESMLQLKLRKKFEDLFRYDQDGLPRVFKQGDNIDKFFKDARDSCEGLIQLFSKMPLPDPLYENEYIKETEGYDEERRAILILSQSKQRDLLERLKRDSDAIFMEVKRGLMTTFSEVPKEMWLALAVLGFNEFYSLLSFMLSNPLVLSLLIVVAISGIVLYQTGTLNIVLKTSIKVAMQNIKPTIDIIRNVLKEALQQAAQAVNNGNIEMEQLSPKPRSPKDKKDE